MTDTSNADAPEMDDAYFNIVDEGCDAIGQALDSYVEKLDAQYQDINTMLDILQQTSATLIASVSEKADLKKNCDLFSDGFSKLADLIYDHLDKAKDDADEAE